MLVLVQENTDKDYLIGFLELGNFLCYAHSSSRLYCDLEKVFMFICSCIPAEKVLYDKGVLL